MILQLESTLTLPGLHRLLLGESRGTLGIE
jgi:hypothetical protein